MSDDEEVDKEEEQISNFVAFTAHSSNENLVVDESEFLSDEAMNGTYEKLFAEKKILFAEKFSAGILVFRQHPIEG